MPTAIATMGSYIGEGPMKIYPFNFKKPKFDITIGEYILIVAIGLIGLRISFKFLLGKLFNF
jgi:hypothetical protein